MKQFARGLVMLAAGVAGSVNATLCLPVLAESYPAAPEKKLYAEHDLRGKPAPQLQVEKWLGKAVPQTEGKVVLIDFWATWCPDCRRFIPELNGYAKKFGQDIVIVGLSDEPAETVEKFAASTPMNYFLAVDTKKRMMKEVGVKAIPNVLVIGPDNLVRWQGVPDGKEDPLTEAKLSQVLSAAKGR